jgi:hypothetical protein
MPSRPVSRGPEEVYPSYAAPIPRSRRTRRHGFRTSGIGADDDRAGAGRRDDPEAHDRAWPAGPASVGGPFLAGLGGVEPAPSSSTSKRSSLSDPAACARSPRRLPVLVLHVRHGGRPDPLSIGGDPSTRSSSGARQITAGFGSASTGQGSCAPKPKQLLVVCTIGRLGEWRTVVVTHRRQADTEGELHRHGDCLRGIAQPTRIRTTTPAALRPRSPHDPLTASGAASTSADSS